MNPMPDNGMMHVSSPHPVNETLSRLEAIVAARGLSVLARIDHSGDAAKAGLTMSSDPITYFRQRKSWHSADGGCADAGNRSSAQDSRVGRR